MSEIASWLFSLSVVLARPQQIGTHFRAETPATNGRTPFQAICSLQLCERWKAQRRSSAPYPRPTPGPFHCNTFVGTKIERTVMPRTPHRGPACPGRRAKSPTTSGPWNLSSNSESVRVFCVWRCGQNKQRRGKCNHRLDHCSFGYEKGVSYLCSLCIPPVYV